MSYAELVSVPQINGEDVHKLLGATYPVPDLRPMQMSPELEEWKQERYNYLGEVIIPKFVEFDNEAHKTHCVAWVRRTGIDDETMELFDYYQVICDCLPAAQASGKIHQIFACRSLLRSFTQRAKEVDRVFRHSETLVFYTEYNPRSDSLYLNGNGKTAAGRYIVAQLEHTSQHPGVWIANYLGGTHDISLLSVSMGLEPKEVKKIASRLKSRGLITFENETTIRLSDGYRSFLEQLAAT